MTEKQLKHLITQTEAALEREHRRNIKITSRAGWGSGMRRVRIGPSFRRENELEERLGGYIKQLKKLEGVSRCIKKNA